MRERGILFSAPMVRAVLAGTTQTRRVVKPQPPAHVTGIHELRRTTTTGSLPIGCWEWLREDQPAGVDGVRCPYGQPGDRLWVREAWNKFPPWEGYFYAADDHSFGIGECDDSDHIEPHDLRWKPSTNMPREASRLTLEITEVRVERLNEISEDDARAEGAPMSHGERGQNDPRICFHRIGFRELWESINGPGSWAANPWVWVIAFRRLP